MRSKWLAMVSAVAVVGALSATAIGGVAGASAPSKFTGSPIKIGLTYVCNAAIPPSVCEMAPSMQAAVKAANAKGGAKTADGKTHQLQVVVCNNENDRSKTADCGRQFVSEKVAYVTGGAVNADEIVPVLGAAGIAYFNPTPLGTGTVEGNEKNSFLLLNTLGLFQGLVQQLARDGKKDIAVVAQGAGAAIAGITKGIAQRNGASTTLVQVAETNPNWAQAAQQAAEHDVIMMVADKYGTKAFLDAYVQSGKKTPVTSVIGIITDDIIKASGGPSSPLVGGISVGYYPPATDKVWADYRAAMKKYAPKTLQEPASQSMFLSVQLGNEVIKTISGDVTPDAFMNAANAMTSIPTLGGKLPSGLSFQKSAGFSFPGPRLFNGEFWGNLKITGAAVVNTKGATFQPVPAIG